MIFVEPELNSIIVNEVDFNQNRNYMSEFVLALRELNPKKTIHFVVDLEKAPVMFILYFRKLKEITPDLPLALYFRDQSPLLVQILKQYNLPYKDITLYPYALPNEENIDKIVDPFDSVEGIANIEEIAKEEGWMPLTPATKDN